MHREALEHEDEENGSVWDCTLIKIMREHKDTVVNPIYEWSYTDVWEYLKGNGYSYNPMYDMGYTRCGCIGCPLATYKVRKKEFKDFPSFKERYIKAFQLMLDKRKADGKVDNERWKDGQSVFDWWIEKYKHEVKGQIEFEFEDK